MGFCSDTLNSLPLLGEKFVFSFSLSVFPGKSATSANVLFEFTTQVFASFSFFTSSVSERYFPDRHLLEKYLLERPFYIPTFDITRYRFKFNAIQTMISFTSKTLLFYAIN